jgi:hypothetical protein
MSRYSCDNYRTMTDRIFPFQADAMRPRDGNWVRPAGRTKKKGADQPPSFFFLDFRA